MTSEELTQQLRLFVDRQSGQEMEDLFLRTVFDIRDAVRDRVQNSGTNSKGKPFVPYVQSYAKERQKRGFQIRKVDYTRSGRLWGSITPIVVSNDGETIVIEVGPRGRDNELKLLGPGTLKNRKDGQSRGLITLPNDREISDAFEDMILSIVDDFEKTVK